MVAPVVRRSEQIREGTKKPSRYAMHTKLWRGLHNNETTNAMIAQHSTVEKFKADGSRDKFKSRLAAHRI
jgi:hypothetical protein